MSERREYDAYRRAWKVRKSAGDRTTTPLLNEWARVAYEPEEEERSLWLEAWSLSVPPRRLGRFVLKVAGRELGTTMRDIRDIVHDPELPDWLLPPPGFRVLSVGFVSGDVKKRVIEFMPDAEPSEVLDRVLCLREKKDGYRKVRVWLNPEHDPSRVLVMAGDSRLGWTSLDKQQMRRLRPKPWARSIKVADGNLKFLLAQNGEIASGKLKVYLPAPR